jgi:hypothetical protein
MRMDETSWHRARVRTDASSSALSASIGQAPIDQTDYVGSMEIDFQCVRGERKVESRDGFHDCGYVRGSAAATQQIFSTMNPPLFNGRACVRGV